MHAFTFVPLDLKLNSQFIITTHMDFQIFLQNFQISDTIHSDTSTMIGGWGLCDGELEDGLLVHTT